MTGNKLSKIEVTLLAAPDEDQPREPTVSIQAAAVPDDVSGLLHQALKLAEKAGPAAGTALVAWLHGRHGRKILGETEVEAGTPEEVERLLDRIEKLKDEPRER